MRANKRGGQGGGEVGYDGLGRWSLVLVDAMVAAAAAAAGASPPPPRTDARLCRRRIQPTAEIEGPE